MLQQLAQTHSAISTMFYCCNQSRGVASVTSDITFRMRKRKCLAHATPIFLRSIVQKRRKFLQHLLILHARTA